MSNIFIFPKHLKHHNAISEAYGHRIQAGDVVGVMLDLHDRTISKSVNQSRSPTPAYPPVHPSIHSVWNAQSEQPPHTGDGQGTGLLCPSLDRHTEEETDRQKRQKSEMHRTSPVCWAVCNLQLTIQTLSLPQMLFLAAKEVSPLPLTMFLHPRNCRALNCIRRFPFAV